MILIEKILIDNLEFSFFDGIDFDVIMNHPKDGTGGFIYCFIDNWSKQVKTWQRESKIDSVLKGKTSKKFDTSQIENNYVSIYQLDGIECRVMQKVIKQKILNNNIQNESYIPVSGINTGAWKISNSKNVS